MIKVKIRTHDATRYLCLDVEGHAGSAPKGEDLVCASASILAYTAAQIARESFDLGDLSCKPHIRLDDGSATVMLRCKSRSAYKRAKSAFYALKTGYNLLAQNYPQYVEAEIRSVARSGRKENT